MQTKKGLQRFTHQQNKLEWLFNLDRVTISDLNQLNPIEKKRALELITENINTLWGNERDKFLKQFSEILDTNTQNQIWENNHTLITGAISNLLNEFNRMPTQTEIAKQTKLSRQTVHYHLKEYKLNPVFIAQMEQYQLLIPSLLARVYKCACKGDIGAAKLYFNVMGCLNSNNKTIIQNQNNYVQFKELVLSQETILQLNPEQILKIEKMLKSELRPQQNLRR